MSITKRMRPKDVEAFRAVAKIQKVYILVRHTNTESVQWMGKPEYMAKPLAVKAKTADADVPGPNGPYKTAGLVVDPKLPNFWFAFRESKRTEAFDEWNKFAAAYKVARCEPRDGKEVRTWGSNFPGFAVQMCPSSKHFGCLMYSTHPNGINGKYIHGDYDLFGIVPADNPTELLRTGSQAENIRMGGPHVRGPNTQSVQFAVNAIAGHAMIKHGEQELFKGFDHDEALDVFCPDGTILQLKDTAEAKHFYRVTLGGRDVFTKKDDVENDVIVKGLWREKPPG